MADADKKTKKPVVTEKMAHTVCEVAGLPPEQIAMLLDSLEKIGKAKKIVRQKSGALFRGRQQKMPIGAAVQDAVKRAQERREREEAIREKYRLPAMPESTTPAVESNIYPKRVSPMDIGRSIDAARERLAEEDEMNMPGEETIRARIVMRVIEHIKILEAMRCARRIARRQSKTIAGKTEENVLAEKETMLEKKRVEDQKRMEEIEKAARSLDGFGKHLHTLVDEAAEVVETDYDASAKVLNQWIGNADSTKEDK